MTHLAHSLEMLGSTAFRVRLRSAEEGARWAAKLRASGRVREAWHTESHLAFVPAEGVNPRELLDEKNERESAKETPREHVLEAVLDGPDRDEVARAAQLSRGQLDQRIYDTPLTVSFVGFSPGFAYLRGLPPSLHLPRREVPRPRIHKGALALAGGFAGIYPSATAGGWNLVGTVHEPVLDDRGPLLSAGDLVRLVPPSLDRTLRDPERKAHGEGDVADAALVLEEVRGLSFIEDGGREGRLHQGMPPSGALLPGWLARANLAVGNAPDAAGIERYGALRVRARVNTVLSTEDGRPHRLRAGESMDLDWHGTTRAGYVAFAGGIDVPSILGGRGTHVRAGLSGLLGRALRKGDALRLFPASLAPATLASREPLEGLGGGLIGVHPGPDLSHFLEGSIARLTSTEWRISHMSDRMGSRLEGGRIEHRKNGPPQESAPLVLGAIEVPPSGEPIVLGPEHPSTGGYPVIGVVRAEDLPAFLSRPLGSTVRFTLASSTQ